MMDQAHILYITYDGLTDTLGQSQIIPYLQGLAKRGYKFTILSCEKRENFMRDRCHVQSLLEPYGIQWEPLYFHKSPPIISKFWDIYQLRKRAVEWMKAYRFSLVHCRSYIPMEIGLSLKRLFGVKVIFDMRGFWVDERVAGGLWNISNPIYRYAFRRYKKKEAQLISNSDYIVVLSEAGKSEVLKWKAYPGSPIAVVPCCVDFETFKASDPQIRKDCRAKLKLNDDNLVFSYLGSIGTWYMANEMLETFKLAKTLYPKAKFLFITPTPETEIRTLAHENRIEADDILVVRSSRQDVGQYLTASDIGLSFILPCYAKLASSPTKLGEILAVGLPVISNSGVGDVKEIVAKIGGGITVDDFQTKTLEAAVSQMPILLKLEPAKIRQKAFEYYDLNRGVDKYELIYRELLN